MTKNCSICGNKLHTILDSVMTLKDGSLCSKCSTRIGLETGPRGLKTSEKLSVDDVRSMIETGTTVTNQITQERPCCPKCKSANIQPLGVHKKGFSVGKAVVGGALTGGIGAVAGFAGKKTKKTDFVCLNCGKQFKL